jgi:ABC-type glycerol-3-phosphate transport system permease component
VSLSPFRLKGLPTRIAIHTILLAGAFLVAFPFLWMILTSLKSLPESAGFPPTIFPSELHWENYRTAWEAADFATALRNTVGMAVVQAFGTVAFTSLAAYAFARIAFRGRDFVFLLFLTSLMIPDEVGLVPSFVILKNLPCPIPLSSICNPNGGWLNTYTAMTVPFMGSVYSIFLLRQFFLALPADLWESCQLDGGGHFVFFSRIVIPLSAPALLTVGLFSFLGSWNAFLWPLIVTSSPDIRPLQVALQTFSSTDAQSRYPELMAASLFGIAPVLILFFLVQRQFVEGIARSGLKG